MNRKGEVGPIGAVVLFLIFLINWFIWLGSWIGYVGKTAVVDNALTGVEAFVLYNLNFFVFIIMILGMLGFIYFGAASQ